MTPEFSRLVRIDTLGPGPRAMTVTAEPGERAALARRFGLEALERLDAALTLTAGADAIAVSGRLRAAAVQSCVASGAPVPATIDEPFSVEFRPQPATAAEAELEVGTSELDVIFYHGASIDVGEAVAETLVLALPPFPRAPDAAAALREAGVLSEEDAAAEKAARSPFAVLKKG